MKYTSEVFLRLSRGQFISDNSVDSDTRAIYADIEENQADYEDYFRQIGFILSSGDGYYYFSREEQSVDIERKLQAVYHWIDYLDFWKTFDTSFDAGSQFNLAKIEHRLSSDIELKEKLTSLCPDKKTNREKIKSLADALVSAGYAEEINETEQTFQVTSAFHYIEQLIMCINIEEETKNAISE